ncbi:hypothetical protein BJV78DRAFT_93611 [Lactifluus subvellereus]|nr:hypothetical protein BJV78DRAFT_93611 [Lactifluus subvellereus]
MSEFFHEVETPFHRSPLPADHFPRLPEELLVEILLCLDARSISACNQTCRTLRRAIADSMLLQHDLALFQCGMLDGPRIDRDHNAQLHRLLAHDAAWRQLEWTNMTQMTHLTGSVHPTAMSGNTVAFIPFGPGLHSGFRLVMQQFPSALRGTEIRQWELQFQLTLVHETLLDSSQDLIILLECDPLCVYLFLPFVAPIDVLRT